MLGFLSKFWGPLEWGMAFKELSIFCFIYFFFQCFWGLALKFRRWGVGGFVERFFGISKFLCLTNMDIMSFELCL